MIRGKWILENLLGTPPPPPPPNVPALKDNTVVGKRCPMRERLARAPREPGLRELPQADGSGRLRAGELRRGRAAGARPRTGEPIDASGGLPDGSKFDGVAGLEQALLTRPELFVGTLTEKLLTFALGPRRGVLRRAGGPQDRPRQRGADDYRFSSLILGIVNSTPFQMRRAQ